MLLALAIVTGGGAFAARLALAQLTAGWRVDHGLRLGGLALGTLLALGALAAIGASAGAARRIRAEETAVLRLAGVSEARLWGPILLLGGVEGLAGGLLGVACLWLASEAGAPWLGGWLDRVGFGPL